jgi:hypothetical protein
VCAALVAAVLSSLASQPGDTLLSVVNKGARSRIRTQTQADKDAYTDSDKQQQANEGTESDGLAPNSVASIICMKLHKTTVKYAARAMEGIVKSITEGVQTNPSKITLGVAPISFDVCWGIRLLCPYVSAYNSVSRRTYVSIMIFPFKMLVLSFKFFLQFL